MRGASASVACMCGVNGVTMLCVQAPNQMAHNYQDEMKSRLSSDTLTSSNPRLVCVDLLFWNFVHMPVCSLCCRKAAFMLPWCCCQTLLCIVLCCIVLFLAACVVFKDLQQGTQSTSVLSLFFLCWYRFYYAMMDDDKSGNWWCYVVPFQHETTQQGHKPRLCPIYPIVNVTQELWHLQCWSVKENNHRDVVPALLLGP